MAKVNFISTTLAKFQALQTKDANSLYFVEDAKRIYKGNVDVTESLKVVTSFDTTPGDDIVEGKLYVNASTFEVRIKNGSDWVILTPGYISTESQFVEANSGKLATIGATKAYITTAISKITNGTAFVKGITFDKATGKLMVDKGDTTATGVELTGIAHDPTYDSTQLKLTIPVIGGDDVVVNIPKDKFVTAGTYNAETQNIELTIDGQDEKVLIPAAALVDTYTADNTGKNIKVTVTDDNKISASLTLDPTSGNALTYTENKGFMVDISGKMDTYGVGTASEIVVSDAEGKTISRTGKTILSDDSEGTISLGTSSTAIPVASVIARAITSAVNAAKSALEATINTKADKLTAGNADEVLLSTADGNYARSGKTIGGATLADTPNSTTLATEAAVLDVVSWKEL